MASPSRVRPLGLLSRRVMVPCVFCGRDRAANEIRLLSERHTSPVAARGKSHGEQGLAAPLRSPSQWQCAAEPLRQCASLDPPTSDVYFQTRQR